MRRPDESRLMAGGAVLAVLGALVLAVVLGLPLARVLAAMGWRIVPCVIDRCELVPRQATDSRGRATTTWYVDALYRYQVDGRACVGTRFELGPWEGGGLGWQRDAVAGVRAIEPAVCWVDPDDPQRAVLVRGLNPVAWNGLVGVPFLAVGGVVWWIGFRARRVRTRRQSEAGYAIDASAHAPAPPRPADDRPLPVSRLVDDPLGLDAPRRPRWVVPRLAGPRALPAESRPGLGAPIGALIALMMLTGLVLMPIARSSVRDGSDGWWWAPLGTLLALAGALVVWAMIRNAAANAPQAAITLDPPLVHPGATVTIAWRLPASDARIERLSFALVGAERVRHDGSGARVETRGLAPMVLHEVEAPVREGACRVVIPDGIMHTVTFFRARVAWWLETRLVVAGGADACDRHELVIYPCAPDAAP